MLFIVCIYVSRVDVLGSIGVLSNLRDDRIARYRSFCWWNWRYPLEIIMILIFPFITINNDRYLFYLSKLVSTASISMTLETSFLLYSNINKKLELFLSFLNIFTNYQSLLMVFYELISVFLIHYLNSSIIRCSIEPRRNISKNIDCYLK